MERLTFTAANSGCEISIPRCEVEAAWIEKHPSGAFVIMASRTVWVKEDPLEMLKELQDKRFEEQKKAIMDGKKVKERKSPPRCSGN